jgi:hypothetical protein
MSIHGNQTKEGYTMKTFNKIISTLGIILLSAVMVFSFFSCQNDPDPGKSKKTEIPSFLQNTEWQNQGGDTVSFTKTSVTVKTASGQQQTFPLKDSQYVADIDQTILFLNSDKTTGQIIYHNGAITMVNLDIIDILNRANGWSENNNNNGNNNNNNNIGYGIYGDFDFSYTSSAVTITRYTGSGGNVTIPSTIDGKPVTAIGDRAFFCNQLTSVTIPNSVTSIGYRAFSDNQLTSVIIPNAVTEIGRNAFDSNQLTSITIPNSVTSIGDYAFEDNQLTSITIPSNSSIGKGTFAGHKLSIVASIIIGTNVTFDPEAFHNYPYTDIGFIDAYDNANKAAGTYIRNTYNYNGNIILLTTWTKIN